MMHPGLLRGTIKSTLELMGMQSPAAVNLLLGTAAQESALGKYFEQLGDGPALGVFQMEPATETDNWTSFIVYRPELVKKIIAVTGVTGPDPYRLERDIFYQIVQARIRYWRVSEALPASDDVLGLARYWKRYYNTPAGAGTEQEFIENYKRYLKPGETS